MCFILNRCSLLFPWLNTFSYCVLIHINIPCDIPLSDTPHCHALFNPSGAISRFLDSMRSATAYDMYTSLSHASLDSGLASLADYESRAFVNYYRFPSSLTRGQADPTLADREHFSARSWNLRESQSAFLLAQWNRGSISPQARWLPLGRAGVFSLSYSF